MKRRNFLKILSASLVAAPILPQVLTKPQLNGTPLIINTGDGWVPIKELTSISPPIGTRQYLPCITEAEMAAARLKNKFEELIFNLD